MLLSARKKKGMEIRMDAQIIAIAERIKGLREILELSVPEMAQTCGVTEQEYAEYESGKKDFTFTFLYKCAKRLGVDITELMTGEPPRLSGYTLTRKGEGLPIKRRKGFDYENMAYLFRDKIAEPFIVTAKYSAEEESAPIALSVHEDQEFDMVLSGSLKFVYEGHVEILHEGDCVYYDSRRGHGMIATGGKDCKFLAVVMRKQQ